MTSGVLTAIIFLTLFMPQWAYAVPDNNAGAAILVQTDTGRVLYSKNADSHMLIASTTKIMTALVVLGSCDPDEQVKILPEYAKVEGSSMYLKAGEIYTVRDLLYGMLLVSGNDAATALACYCGGSIEGFAEMMNEKARELGLADSSFKNPHGLDADGHYSSAQDLATITCEAMKSELFAKIVSTKTYSVGEQTYMNHNKLLWNYSGCLGVKTGYTIAAGRSLVSCAERDGLQLVCVTLSDPDDWNDHSKLYDWAFSTYEYKRVLPMGVICELPVISGAKDSVGISASEDSRILVEKGTDISFSLELPKFVYAGIKAGDCAGRAFVKQNNTVVAEYPLNYAESVELADNAKLSAWGRIKRAWFIANKYGFVFEGAD
ncbi:MAG: D-alanyl-D-alanine carboxypeptidase family protein [Oscillospiraceae bacterium]|nr:D-alanyl-D-alanine carboxypeptidase family protein [Oscillospiraceae bacterium]